MRRWTLRTWYERCARPVTGLGSWWPSALEARKTPQPEAAFDLTIVGGGSAAFAAAVYAAEEGASVLMINDGPIGGTCVNVGCVPSKFLIRAMESYHRAGEGRFPGVSTSRGSLHWPSVVKAKDDLVAQLVKGKYVDVLGAYPSVKLRQGRATLVPGGVRVNGETIPARKVLVATGASPWFPPIAGLPTVGPLTSDDALALRQLPGSLLVLGGNAVGLELAQVFARAGVAVTVVELLPRIAPFEDEEVSAALTAALEAEGIDIKTGYKALSVERQRGRVLLEVQDSQGSTTHFLADELLVATGRRPNTEGLGLGEVGVETDGRGAIRVNEFAQTSNPAIFAAGDCTTAPQLVYVAAHMGTVAATNALAVTPHRHLELELVPRVIFTDPQVAAVGLTEAQARERGLEVTTATLPLDAVPKALTARDTRGLVKLVVAGKEKKLVGVHVVASEASEIIQVATLAVKQGMPAATLASMLFPYLTLAEGLKLAAQSLFRDVHKLSCCAG
ncbi:MAG: mercury(II) reductase [Thermoanaerobaculum sp.]